MVLSKYCTKEWCEFVDHYSEIRTHVAGEYIFRKGEPTIGLFLIIDGKVKVTTSVGRDQERVIRLATNDDLIGHRGFGGDWKYTVSAIALTDSKLRFIPLDIFNAVFRANPDFAYYIMTFFAEELRDSESFTSQLPIKNIVAGVLVKNCETFGFAKGSQTKLGYSLSRRDLASLAGTRYETLVRILSEFSQEGIVRFEGKIIHILNLEKLRDLAGLNTKEIGSTLIDD